MISNIFVAAALIGLAETVPQVESDISAPWAVFSRSPARGSSPVIVSIGTLERKSDGSTIYWAKRDHVPRAGDQSSQVVDSAHCPAILPLAKSMRDIPLPALAPKEDIVIIADATIYSLTAPFSYNANSPADVDRVTIRTASGPLKDWIDHALLSLEPCWPTK